MQNQKSLNQKSQKNLVEKSPLLREEDIEEIDMEPDGDIEKHSDEIERYALQFAGVKELNYLWVRSKKDKTKECYDDLACMCLEWNYWQYMKGGPTKDQFRFVHFVPNTIVDLECYCETDVAFNDTEVDSLR